MHRPEEFWRCVSDLASAETVIFVADLRRPNSLEEAYALVSKHAEGAPQVLREDFFNSLCAAFTEVEIRQQLEDAKLSRLTISPTADRHVVIFGRKG